MIAGITGTRRGMTAPQKATFRTMIEGLRPATVLHGACVGADEEAVVIARESLGDRCHIIAYPGSSVGDTRNRKLRSALAIELSDEVKPINTYHARNREIVADCTILIAASATFAPTDSGGTWFTIRHALKLGMEPLVIIPDGTFLPV